jgi:hypothetical protein
MGSTKLVCTPARRGSDIQYSATRPTDDDIGDTQRRRP